MKKTLLLWCICSLLTGTATIQAQNYLKPGVRWTEIQLDTLLHDSWYSQVETEEGIAYVPNFEVVEYRIEPEGQKTEIKWQHTTYYMLHDVVATPQNRPDSLVCFLYSDDYPYRDYSNIAMITHWGWDDPDTPQKDVFWQVDLYDWEGWETGKKLYYMDLLTGQMTGYRAFTYGVIKDTGEDFFGGTKPLKYADMDNGLRIIQGIGVTAWDGNECILGPAAVYHAYRYALFSQQKIDEETSQRIIREHQRRSMLVRFEDSNGQVLYDMWPNGKGQLEQGMPQTLAPQKPGGIYDLQGRKLQRRPAKGLFIEDGKLKTR